MELGKRQLDLLLYGSYDTYQQVALRVYSEGRDPEAADFRFWANRVLKAHHQLTKENLAVLTERGKHHYRIWRDIQNLNKRIGK